MIYRIVSLFRIFLILSTANTSSVLIVVAPVISVKGSLFPHKGLDRAIFVC
jgi:hypothetical protein